MEPRLFSLPDTYTVYSPYRTYKSSMIIDDPSIRMVPSIIAVKAMIITDNANNAVLNLTLG